MTANLKAWLEPLARESGPVYPAGVYRVRFLEAVRTAGITPWPPNALRHSAASYQLALSQNSAATAFQMGHNETVLNNSYKELVGP